MLAWLERLDAEGFQDPVPPTVDEAVRVTGGTDDDRLMWLKIANRGLNTFLGVLMEFEYDLERHACHPLRNPCAAFQARLNRVLPFPGAAPAKFGASGLGDRTLDARSRSGTAREVAK